MLPTHPTHRRGTYTFVGGRTQSGASGVPRLAKEGHKELPPGPRHRAIGEYCLHRRHELLLRIVTEPEGPVAEGRRGCTAKATKILDTPRTGLSHMRPRIARCLLVLRCQMYRRVFQFLTVPDPEDCVRRVGSILWIVRGRTPSPTPAYDQEDRSYPSYAVFYD
ncbi:hypothetical protein SK128_016627 [Halocaridina rubra]|uniref:Uncharacterized protein n=1 Tax=Halocaridina rubra TaxID=373956 RepID=A0AAN8WL59_HALRR